ncbi:Protein NRDE2 [Phytophthora citrophthora]|uniref:Protein NRDE2 n=1 Tax=Phytophthora citrophthora TaxID=4793 RepID=A0AAD9LS57_9STRA|nr:Protein NRDE2 [Phytophthora citrophthora]
MRSRHRYRRHRRRSRSRSKSRSRSRSRSLSSRAESRVVKQPTSEVVVHDQKEADDDKIFELDRVGDRENQFFGSVYANDQPLYKLATRRSLLTGAKLAPVRPQYTTNEVTDKQKEERDSSRYFSLIARKAERDGRQKRLYLAYSEKRLSRIDSNTNRDARAVCSRQTEMDFIPLDPVLDGDELRTKVAENNNSPDRNDVSNGVLLSDGQNVEQHLVQRSKILNAAVTANPHDIDNWLDLMVFQEETMRLHTKTAKLSSAMNTSVAEKQGAILAKALATNPQSRVLHRIKLNMLGSGADVDSFQQQLETLLSEDSTNRELWLKLLQSHQQHFGSFSMQSVRDLYARILTVLRQNRTSATATKDTRLPLSPDSREGGDASITLLDFHFLMCQFEKKAGFIERAIAQLQALLDFCRNFNGIGGDRGGVGSSLEMLGKQAPTLSDAAFRDYIKGKVTTADKVNPSEVLRTEGHKQSLLSTSAVYQRRSRIKNGSRGVHGKDGVALLNENSPLNDSSEEDAKQDRKAVYSNMHGYRINIDEADDAGNYERILRELRGTERAQSRRYEQLEKGKMKLVELAVTKAQIEDQRANYDLIDEDDRFVHWLMLEEEQAEIQWAPLNPHNPLHQDLIEQQPDRAILAEEIQPFLFPVPVVYQWRIVVELLQICGVDWGGACSWETSFSTGKSMYADCAEDYELLVAPILSVLDPQPSNPNRNKLFLNPCDRKLLLGDALLQDVSVKQGLLRDPSKVDFIRQTFAQALDIFAKTDLEFASALKSLWVGFEAEVVHTVGVLEESLAYVRHLSQQLARKDADGSTDFNVLYSYAKLELRLGNERQVRRICDNTLKSLGLPSTNDAVQARTFHRFLYLRMRLEICPSFGDKSKNLAKGELQKLRCLYTLWNAFQPVEFGDKKKETLETTTKKHQKWPDDYLSGLLMSDPAMKSDLIARYRAELGFAVQHCGESKHPGCCEPLFRSSCWVGDCLHNLVLVVYAYDGFDAACHEYRQALTSEEHKDCEHVSRMWTCFLDFMQQHQISGLFPPLSPRVWRSAVGEAVATYPRNKLFLRLFVDSETGNTISQVLRNYFLQVEKRWRRHYDSPELVEWLFALLCEFCRAERAATLKGLSMATESSIDRSSCLNCCLFHRWGMNATAVSRIRHLFEKMVTQIRTKGNALCWGLYMRFEVALGKVDAAKKILYRGIAACAWSKELYMDGIRIMRAYLSEAECQELLTFMEAKELNLRVELE